MVDRSDETPLGHDGYLKLWALSQPTLKVDYILLDEAQDTNAVVLGVLAKQAAQVVYVGDRHQQIYEWRGAVNAMEKISGCEDAALTQSFRFGHEIATAASQVVATLGEQKQIRGNPAVNSSIEATGRANAVLARTNATVILEVLEATRTGMRPCVCGGTQELKRLLSDVYELKAGKPGISPEFFGFQNWAEVVEFADSEEGQALRTFVQLVEQHGEAKLWAAVNKAVADENAADIVLSTAHKAKGREWDAVRLAPDFMNVRLGPDADAQSEVRLFYVAMTRAKKLLVADPELMRTFATNAWKTRREEPRPRPVRTAAGIGRAQPAPAPREISEINPAASRMQHPGAVRSPVRAAPEQPGAGVRPQPAPIRDIREITPAASAIRHPGAAVGNPARGDAAVAPTAKTAPQREKFWSRVARFFGG